MKEPRITIACVCALLIHVSVCKTQGPYSAHLTVAAKDKSSDTWILMRGNFTYVEDHLKAPPGLYHDLNMITNIAIKEANGVKYEHNWSRRRHLNGIPQQYNDHFDAYDFGVQPVVSIDNGGDVHIHKGNQKPPKGGYFVRPVPVLTSGDQSGDQIYLGTQKPPNGGHFVRPRPLLTSVDDMSAGKGKQGSQNAPDDVDHVVRSMFIPSTVSVPKCPTKVSPLLLEEVVEFSLPLGVHRYKVFPERTVKTWDQAKEYCEKEGGYLFIVDNQLEGELVRSLTNSDNFHYSGFKKVPGTNTFKTIHGNVINHYYTWDTNQPQLRERDDCGCAYMGNKGKLHDCYCDESLPFVCEEAVKWMFSGKHEYTTD